MSEAFSFTEQLAFGKEWEERASHHLKSMLQSISYQNVSYENRPELQRAGIDTIFKKDEPAIDVKTQAYDKTKTGNLPLETMSVEEENVPGWLYTSEADLIVWVYPNKAGTNLHHIGYFMPHSDDLVAWFNERLNDFRRVRVPNDTQKYGSYHTACRLVPVDDFPDRFLVEFDPRLPTEKKTPQSDLAEWSI